MITKCDEYMRKFSIDILYEGVITSDNPEKYFSDWMNDFTDAVIVDLCFGKEHIKILDEKQLIGYFERFIENRKSNLKEDESDG